MDNGKRNAAKVLTTDDIRKHARDWTLAGDVGLLAHLEEFSENLTYKTQETQKYFDELLENYEKVYTKVGNVTNQFLALQNCQFVENRVYDEETPTEEKTETKVQDHAEQEKLLLLQYKEAVEVGVKLLDTHFQEVQLPPNSDSDEEDELSTGNSIIWRPKNPYVDKKFPLLIGSAEWWKDDRVGLANSQETFDFDKAVSESESDVESAESIEKKPKLSSSLSMENVKAIPVKPTFLESSSEDLFGLDGNKDVKRDPSDDEFSFKGSNPVLNEPINFLPPERERQMNEKEDLSDGTSIPQTENATKPPKMVENAFTRELMAKLVSVKSEDKQEGGRPEEILPPARHEQPPPQENIFDETDDSGDLFSASGLGKAVGGKDLFFDVESEDQLFAGSNDLFSDSGGDLFKGDALKKPETQTSTKRSQEIAGDLKNDVKIESNSFGKGNLVKDLFDDLDDGDALFAPRSTQDPQEKRSFEKPSRSSFAAEFGWGNDEGLFDSINNDLEDDFLSRPSFLRTEKKGGLSEMSSSSKEKKEGPAEQIPSAPKPESDSAKTKAEKEVEVETKTTAGESLPSSFLSQLSDEDDLFSGSFKEEKKGGRAAGGADEESSSLFLEKPKQQDSLSVSSSRSSLFDEASASKSRLASVFTKERGSRAEEDLFGVSEDSLFVGEAKRSGKDLFAAKAKKQEMSSLFGDSDDEDLFGSPKEKGNLSERVEGRSGNVQGVEGVAGGAEKKSNVATDDGFLDDWADDDLFRKSPAREESEKVSGTKSKDAESESLTSSEPNLIVESLAGEDEEVLPKVETAAGPAEVKRKPPSSQSSKGSENEPKSKSVGKLNIPDNLKLKLETVTKHTPAGGGTKMAEKTEGWDEFLESSSNLLNCPSRDRARIPGRRRPQSRRARQEAIRSADARWEESSSSGNPPHPGDSARGKNEASSLPSPVVSNPLSPSTDEEDFFNVPELDANSEEDQGIFKSNLFESAKSSKIEDNFLFESAPVLSPLAPTKKGGDGTEEREERDSLFSSRKNTANLSIFEDEPTEDEEENLFKSEKPRGEAGAAGIFRNPVGGERVRSLFDAPQDAAADEEDDDDLFGGKANVALGGKSLEEKKKENAQVKEKKSQTFVDPLGLMSNDE